MKHDGPFGVPGPRGESGIVEAPHAEAVREAVLRERERCAKIAESSAVHHNGAKVGTGIAARIREGN